MKRKQQTVTKSRKQLRKEFRQSKKANKHLFFSKRSKHVEEGEHEPVVQPVVSTRTVKKAPKKRFSSLQDEQKYENKQERHKQDMLQKQMQRSKIQQLKNDNMEEDREIKKLEKYLKLNKRKSSSVPKLFTSDGLDYLLEVCDRNKFESSTEAEHRLQGIDSDFEDDFAEITGKTEVKSGTSKGTQAASKEADSDSELENDAEDDESISDIHESSEEETIAKSNKRKLKQKDINKNKKSKKIKITFKEATEKEKDGRVLSGEDEDLQSEESEEEEIDTNDEDDGGTSEEGVGEEEGEREEVKEVEEAKSTWEDIYGRTRDKQGNIVSVYRPPQLQAKLGKDGTDSDKLVRLKRQLKGLLNRLAENNMAAISSQVEESYMKNSRNDMNETLCKLTSEAIISVVLTPERLIMEHAMLVTVLNSNVGNEVGAFFLQHMVTRLVTLLDSHCSVEDKQLNNIMLFITCLYNFKVFHSDLLYDIVRRVLIQPGEKEVELVLIVLRTAGSTLRKDDPASLKTLVLRVHEVANTPAAEQRMKFMLDVMAAVKNNNMRKIPNYDPEPVERLKKSLKVLVRKGSLATELKISLTDLLNADKLGRWWIVGSAWSGTGPGAADDNEDTRQQKKSTASFSQKLLDLARKQRMNTDVRRTVFCILMSAEDYLDAFEKLLRLRLKGTGERDMLNVLIHCTLQEKQFNPYYYHLASKMCHFDRKYQIMMQYAVWDRLKELKNMERCQLSNLAKLIGHVVLSKGLSVSVLKVIEFSDLNKTSLTLIRQVLLTILLSSDEDAVLAVFTRVARPPGLKVFREGLRLFLHHFLLRNMKKMPEEDVDVLQRRAKLMDQALVGENPTSLL